MAMFREHISWGGVVALFGTGAAFFYVGITDPMLLAILFALMVVMSFMPDLDSDDSTPYRLIYGAFTVACTTTALYYVYTKAPNDYTLLIGVPSLTLLAVWFVIGGMFKAWTRHRGMFHSIPAMVIAGLGTYLVALHLGASELVAITLGAGAGLGYFSHLLLDEIYSGILLDGTFFKPKKSLGTALKLFSTSTTRTFFTYALLALLTYFAYMSTIT